MQQLDFSDASPAFPRRSSDTSCLNEDEDDGFLEVLDDNVEVRPLCAALLSGLCPAGSNHICVLPQDDSGMPMGMASLLTAPLVADSAAQDSVSRSGLPALCAKLTPLLIPNDRRVVVPQPVVRCRPRSLFRSPSMPSPASRPSAKRPDCPAEETTPVRVKRRRSLAGSHVTSWEQSPETPRGVSPQPVTLETPGRNAQTPPLAFQGASLLQRSKSFCQTEIEKLLDGEDGSNQLIGDFTKVRMEAGVSNCLKDCSICFFADTCSGN